MADPAPDLPALLNRTHLTSHDDLLKASNAALKKNKSDLTAHITRVVAYLKLDQFENAVSAFDEGGDRLKGAAPLEYAYTLYKAGQFEKAEEATHDATTEDRGLAHVAAQTRYRLEKFPEAARLYAQLASSKNAAEEAAELRVNRSATDAQLQWKGLGYLAQHTKPQREDLEAFESSYNAACASIAQGELGQGEALLRRARRDLSDAERQAELVPIIAQQIYVLMRLSRDDEAEKLAAELDIEQIPDLSTKHIANANIVASQSQPNPFLAQRIFKSTAKLPKNDLPFTFQATALKQNEYTVALHSLKFPGTVKSTASKLKKEVTASLSPEINTLAVLHAAAKAKAEAGKASLKLVLPLLEERPGDVGLLLTIIQLYALTGNIAMAMQVLDSFLKRLEASKDETSDDVRFSPGLVGTAVSLQIAQGSRKSAKATLAAAAAYWRSKRELDDAEPMPCASLLHAAGSELVVSNERTDLEQAAAVFGRLHRHDTNDRVAVAGLIGSLAAINSGDLDSSLVDSLPATDRLIEGIDAQELEAQGIANLDELIKNKKRNLEHREAEKPVKKKRKLPKSRRPKDYEEGKTMDPERWLPLRDRSYWKPKGRKVKQRAAGLRQGGAVEDDKKAADVSRAQPASSQQKKKKKAKGGKR